MSKNIYQLLGSRVLAEFGSSMYAIILPLIILGISDSLKNVGLFYSIIKIPAIVLLPFMGVAVERLNRKKLILLCNIILILIFSMQFFLFFTGKATITILAIIGIIINLAASVNDISTRVIFSEIVPPDQLEKYNGAKSVIDNSAVFIAPMLGTFLYGFLGIQIVVAIILLLYIAAVSGFFSLNYSPNSLKEKKSAGILKEMSEGLNFVKSKRTILAFFVLTTTLNFFVASTEEIINPGILISKYAIPAKFFGFSSTFNILGIILAGIFISRNKKIDFQKHLSKLFIVNSCIMILIGVTSVLFQGNWKYAYYGIFLFLQILLGFFTILINVPLTSYFQANVPIHFQGRFFSFFSFAANLSIPFGITYSGFSAEHFGADTTYILNNLLVILIVLWTYNSVDILGKKE